MSDLTDAQIDAMPAGREMSEGDRALDLWLAEHVFGWTHILPDGFGRPPMVRGGYGHFPHEQVPSYTGQCWPQVAEALAAKGWYVEIEYHPNGHRRAKMILWPGSVEYVSASAFADTPGLALGRAAEQALGGGE